MLEFSGKTIATFLAHPDDETLGCGGTLARAVDEGANVYCIIPVKRIGDQCEKALETLGVQNLDWGNFSDNEMDAVPLMDVSKFLEWKLDKIKPDLLITHTHRCMNQDHRVCYEAACIATRPIKRPIQLLSCEIPSSTGYLRPSHFEPNLYVGLDGKFITRKQDAIAKYESEKRDDRSSNLIRCIAKVRGAESGTEFAEGFEVIRAYA
jgi:LmbE family N-acetylglucosaminyl deacetylase